MKSVLVTVLAQREIEAAASFFESRKEGLGEEFEDRVAAALQAIKIAPESFQKVYKDLRRCGLCQFPDWGLFYRVMPDNSVVVACLSARRDPRLLRERASGVVPFPKPDPQ